MKDYRFLIYISFSYSIPIGNPLEEEIIKRGYQVKWFADEEEGASKIKDKPNKLNSAVELIKYKPDVVLTITNDVPDFISGLKVQVFHGFLSYKRPTKKNKSESHFRIRGFFDLYCTHGPSTTYEFKKLAKKYNYFRAIETGFSKVDPLFPLLLDKEKNDIPTIMIASTFTKRLSLAYDESVYDEIQKLAKTARYNFKMVLHPKIPIETKAKWKALESDYFTFIDTTNLIPIFKESDILFADTTSAIQEYLLQRKPVVAYNHTFLHPYLLHVNQAENIEETFIKALNPTDELLNTISDFTNKLHPYTDGKSSKRVVDASISFLNQDRPNMKAKPLNLIRKIKIRNKLNYLNLKSIWSIFSTKHDY